MRLHSSPCAAITQLHTIARGTPQHTNPRQKANSQPAVQTCSAPDDLVFQPQHYIRLSQEIVGDERQQQSQQQTSERPPTITELSSRILFSTRHPCLHTRITDDSAAPFSHAHACLLDAVIVESRLRSRRPPLDWTGLLVTAVDAVRRPDCYRALPIHVSPGSVYLQPTGRLFLVSL